MGYAEFVWWNKKRDDVELCKFSSGLRASKWDESRTRTTSSPDQGFSNGFYICICTHSRLAEQSRNIRQLGDRRTNDRLDKSNAPRWIYDDDREFLDPRLWRAAYAMMHSSHDIKLELNVSLASQTLTRIPAIFPNTLEELPDFNKAMSYLKDLIKISNLIGIYLRWSSLRSHWKIMNVCTYVIIEKDKQGFARRSIHACRV